jgi:hypothetical protein
MFAVVKKDKPAYSGESSQKTASFAVERKSMRERNHHSLSNVGANLAKTP